MAILFLFLILGPCYLFLMMDENENYQGNTLSYSIYYLIADIIFSLIFYSFNKMSNPDLTIVWTLMWSVIRAVIFYFVMIINKHIQRRILSSIIFLALELLVSYISYSIANNM